MRINQGRINLTGPEKGAVAGVLTTATLLAAFLEPEQAAKLSAGVAAVTAITGVGVGQVRKRAQARKAKGNER